MALPVVAQPDATTQTATKMAAGINMAPQTIRSRFFFLLKTTPKLRTKLKRGKSNGGCTDCNGTKRAKKANKAMLKYCLRSYQENSWEIGHIWDTERNRTGYLVRTGAVYVTRDALVT